MEGNARREELCPRLLDLIPKDRDRRWPLSRDRGQASHGSTLELRLGLGPPGDEDLWTLKANTRSERNHHDDQDDRQQSPLLSLGYFAKTTEKKKAFSQQEQSSLPNTAVTNSTSQKRTAPAPVVGWPPIRSFRKNLANASSSKPTSDHSHSSIKFNNNKAVDNDNNNNNNKKSEKSVETNISSGGKKGLFVKINMEGVPIGRKVDLKAYDSYQNLSSAVDQLFRGLLAAQRDSSGSGIQKKEEEEKAITGLLDGSGEYTLVYEDNEGDRMLVGDVPWNMFVSTVKRLRVLKSSEISALSLVSGKQDQMRLDSSLK